MTNQYALGYKAGLDAAVKVCFVEGSDIYAPAYYNEACRVIETKIAALPVPEIQWRDLTEQEINELWDNAMLVADPTAGNHRFKFARAVIAKFKEKQL